MAISKFILNGVTLIDLTADTVATDNLLSSYTAHKNDGTQITGTVNNVATVTVTDQANSTGTTCVITTDQSSAIPIGVQLIDFTKIKNQYRVRGSTGEEVYEEYGCSSDYTLISPSMTFSYIGYEWWDLAFYDSTKTYISGFRMEEDSDSIDGNGSAHGTLTPSKIPSNATYIRISAEMGANSDSLSLIRTA